MLHTVYQKYDSYLYQDIRNHTFQSPECMNTSNHRFHRQDIQNNGDTLDYDMAAQGCSPITSKLQRFIIIDGDPLH